ncbi:hypothetical protein QPK32_06410 [Massilia sp. YIM B02763]|uniref:hypothetical protein n=1 Tax=Massilia sp. YIM B02763 TaxID=3050130 RepID=UPI0025B69244|nr:hypothetical protein [Massilia sp. YIM B02763]MDN4052701.1 hypothetical protein [Massilia sp. YIM B02763]
MRRIDKGVEPRSLTAWKRAHQHGTYADLPPEERQAIRQACALEQYYLCGYCCDAISGEASDTTNEHVEAQKLAPHRTVDFSNIIASCAALHHCDKAHGSQALPLTPLMAECESELRYKISGRVEGLTDRAREAIRVLNLGDAEQANKALIEKRKALCNALLWTNGIDPEQGLEDEELIRIVIADLLQPKEGRLEAFAPVLANIMSAWLEGRQVE